MSAAWAVVGEGQIVPLILQALTRKLVAKGVLSPDEVRELLIDAATQLNVLGSEQTRGAATAIVDESLAPAFLKNP